MKNKTKWDELSIREKADLMKLFVDNDITDLNQIHSLYNSYQNKPLGSYATYKNGGVLDPAIVISNKYGGPFGAIIIDRDYNLIADGWNTVTSPNVE